MFVVVFLVILLCKANADSEKVNYRCVDISDNSSVVTFNLSSDGVSGRYTAELCTLNNPNWTDWTIDLSYYDNPKYCNRYGVRRRHSHSTNTISLNEPVNCTHVCYAMNFDLVFSSCYEVKSTFKKGSLSYAPIDSYHNVSNNLTKEYLFENKPHVSFVNHDDEVSLTWFLGIPATDFKVELCHIHNVTKSCVNSSEVTSQCAALAALAAQVRCGLAPAHGCYRATLEHAAPWIVGVFRNHTYVTFDFCHRPVSAPALVASGAAWRWACGGALLACAALLAAAAARRALLTRAIHKHLIEAYRTNREAVTAHTQPVVVAEKRAILLLYAREGPAGQAAVAALTALLEHATGAQVYDLFSAQTAALSASAPASWLRGVLRRRDVSVLLLQSPALAALYRAQLCREHDGLTLQEPLLGRRALYREPQFGDALLALALRMLAEHAPAHHDYHKYHLATYSGLEVDVVPQVVPYRRYELPAATAALLAALAAGDVTPDDAHMHNFTSAVQEFLHYVQHNPDYLKDEIFIV